MSLITLSALLDRLHLLNVDLMKIDIEGYEYEAILGSPVVFQEHRVKTIVLELHPDSICKRGLAAERIGLILEECGYEQDEGLPVRVYKTRDKTQTKRPSQDVMEIAQNLTKRHKSQERQSGRVGEAFGEYPHLYELALVGPCQNGARRRHLFWRAVQGHKR